MSKIGRLALRSEFRLVLGNCGGMFSSSIQVSVEKDTKTNNRLLICQGVGFTSLSTSQSSLVLREAQLVLRKE